MKTTKVEFGYASVKDVTLPEGGGLTDQTESFWGGTSIISSPPDLSSRHPLWIFPKTLPFFFTSGLAWSISVPFP